MSNTTILQKKNCVVFLTHKPIATQLLYYKEFNKLGYDVFVIVDDDEWQTLDINPLKIIQIKKNICENLGYFNLNPQINSNVSVRDKAISAWDKAIYYFTKINNTYDNCWFIEEDVLIPHPNILGKIDQKHTNADLLVGDCKIIDKSNEWVWKYNIPKNFLSEPYAHGMVCAVRISHNLLKLIEDFLTSYSGAMQLRNKILIKVLYFSKKFYKLSENSKKKLFQQFRYPFIEFIFHTLALNKNLKVDLAEELGGIIWREKDWSIEEMEPNKLYHPVKNIKNHPKIRQELEKKLLKFPL